MSSDKRPKWKPTTENPVYDLKKELAKLGPRGMLKEAPPPLLPRSMWDEVALFQCLVMNRGWAGVLQMILSNPGGLRFFWQYINEGQRDDVVAFVPWDKTQTDIRARG